jgi:hypothetical protein
VQGEKRQKSESALDLDINDLAPPVHAVGGVYAMRPEGRPVGGIGRQLRGLELVGSPALAGPLFGLFAFRLGHDESGLMIFLKWKT